MSDSKKRIVFPHGIHLTQFLDEEMEPSARDDFARSLNRNSSLQGEVDGLRDTISVLNRLPFRQAPEQSEIIQSLPLRRRLRQAEIGFLGDVGRFPIEAVFHVILIALLMALYLGSLPPADRDVQPATTSESERGSQSSDGATY